MKFTTAKTVFIWVIVGIVGALLAACGGNSTGLAPQAGPQIIVVTATPQPEWRIEVTEEAAVEAGATAVPMSAEPGTLLQGRGKELFYLTEDGTRQRIYNRDTFLAFGFTEKEIVPVDDDTLATIPLAGELSRLVQDRRNRLYWAADGKLWSVNAWRRVVTGDDYLGVPVSQLYPSLQEMLPPAAEFPNGILLRQDDTVYYLYYGAIIPVATDLADEADVIDVPDGVLAAYRPETQLERVFVHLNADTQAANMRQGPGLEYDVIKVIEKGNDLIRVTGHTPEGHWLFIKHRDDQGWLSVDLVDDDLALSLLPTVSNVEKLVEDLPQAQPAAVIEQSQPQPVYCDETPIRGFGTVWGEHPEVQTTLGCPYGREQGTQAAIQHFQHGLMLWLEADSVYNYDPVYVFFDDGTYQRFGDLGAADPEKVGHTPAGFFEVGHKFSKVYWEGTGARVKERLGYATGQATDSAGAFQQFGGGRMFWAGTIDRIFVIYDYYDYDENGNYVRQQAWESYEDTF